MNRCLIPLSKDSHSGDAASRVHPVIMSKTQGGILALAWTRLALHLLVYLIDHTQTGCAQRMTKTLKAAFCVYRQLAIQFERAGFNTLFGFAARTETEIFVDGHFGDREAIVHFGKIDFRHVIDSISLVTADSTKKTQAAIGLYAFEKT